MVYCARPVMSATQRPGLVRAPTAATGASVLLNVAAQMQLARGASARGPTAPRSAAVAASTGASHPSRSGERYWSRCPAAFHWPTRAGSGFAGRGCSRSSIRPTRQTTALMIHVATNSATMP
jgi:hypothetical protein